MDTVCVSNEPTFITGITCINIGIHRYFLNFILEDILII